MSIQPVSLFQVNQNNIPSKVINFRGKEEQDNAENVSQEQLLQSATALANASIALVNLLKKDKMGKALSQASSVTDKNNETIKSQTLWDRYREKMKREGIEILLLDASKNPEHKKEIINLIKDIKLPKWEPKLTTDRLVKMAENSNPYSLQIYLSPCLTTVEVSSLNITLKDNDTVGFISYFNKKECMYEKYKFDYGFEVTKFSYSGPEESIKAFKKKGEPREFL